MKIIKRLIGLIIIAFLIFVGYEAKLGYDRYSEAIADKPLNAAVSELKSKNHYTEYEQIPEIYFDALVAVEDRRFYSHKGFDIIGTARAIYNDIKAWDFIEGGSTITQQLAKNLYFSDENTLERKIAEILMAILIERNYEKKDILELYVNGIYYGSGYYCIYDAAQGYFGKEPWEMTDDECTLLVGIPNAPSVYSLDVNPDLARQRQKLVLMSMVDTGYISENEMNNILNN